MPKVLNRHCDPVPAGAVYIGHPSPSGNPFVIGQTRNRQEVIAKYRAWLLTQPDLVAAARAELAGKDLVRFCTPAVCHGDVLLGLANTR